MTARPSPRDNHPASDVRNSQQSSDIVEMVTELRDPWLNIGCHERERVAETLIALNNRAFAAEVALEASHHAELVEMVIALLETRSVEDEAIAIERAEALLAKLGVLRSCPVCSGDCSAANPPVLNCPMRAKIGGGQ